MAFLKVFLTDTWSVTLKCSLKHKILSSTSGYFEGGNPGGRGGESGWQLAKVSKLYI